MAKILIVIDMQNDFVHGDLGTPQAINIIPNIVKKLEEYTENRNGHWIYFTKDTHNNLNYLNTQEGKFLPIKHCIADSRGWDIVDELRPYAARTTAKEVIEKRQFGTFNFVKIFEEDEECIDSIELCGVCTDICVITNALILKTAFPEIPIYVDPACCAGTTQEKHLAALEVMKSCQIIVDGGERNI